MKDKLERSIKTPGAILMGLGFIVGTGFFVSIDIATQVVESGVIISTLRSYYSKLNYPQILVKLM